MIAGREAHATIFSALRMIGLGRDSAHLVAADDQGRMEPEALARELEHAGPAIVCAQAGNVNSGAFDPLEPIEYLCEQSGAWLHVDGAFGLWAAASPEYRHLTRGIERADSWATDGHKWLNVPYDCGLAIVQGPRRPPPRDGPHRRLPRRRRAARQLRLHARGLAPRPRLPALRRPALAGPPRPGRADRAQLRAGAPVRGDPRAGGAEILNDVVLNQVLVAAPPDAVARIQADGTCWVGGSNWHGRDVIRISCSSWATTDADVERSARAILSAITAP